MSLVYIGIGGTGAKVLESLIHICAMGLGPASIRPLIIDTDDSNGNKSHSLTLLNLYNRCQKLFGIVPGTETIFRTKFLFNEQTLHWNPKATIKGSTLADYFRIQTLKANEETRALGDMCDMLYSKPELVLNWGEGFRGRPSIGAPVMAHMSDALSKEPWVTIINELKTACGNNNPARVFIAASIFGGTGASGFPTVAKCLRNESQKPGQKWPNAENLQIGGCMLLPYFRYSTEKADQKEVYARPENFALNTAAALRYYADEWRVKSPFNQVFLIGNQILDTAGQRQFAEGGDQQKNDPHFVELYAALATADYLRKTEVLGAGSGLQEHQIGRQEKDSLEWLDIQGQWDFMTATLSFLTMAFAYLGFYKPLIDRGMEERPHMIPWYVDKFDRDELVSTEAHEARTVFGQYLSDYLDWVRKLHTTTTLKVRLVNPQVCDPKVVIPLSDDLFRTVRYRTPETSPEYNPQYKYGYDALWDRMNSVAASLSDATPLPKQGMGKFLFLLHRASREFVTDHYEARSQRRNERRG